MRDTVFFVTVTANGSEDHELFRLTFELEYVPIT
jgi:hypothetical protein